MNEDQDLTNVKIESELKLKQYRRILNDKSVLYDQMLMYAKQLMNRDDLIIKNEEEIIRIKYDIDISKLEMEQKKELVKDLEATLEQDKATYKELKMDIKKLEKRYDTLTFVLKQKEDELDQLEEIIKDRDNIIEELERQLGEKVPEVPKPEKTVFYKPIKGDLADELFAKYINMLKCAVPIKRIGEGNYLFGTKKINAKIMHGKLIIRVGGGSMIIEEFMEAYSDIELQKVSLLIERGRITMDDYRLTSGKDIYGTIGDFEASPSKI